MTSEEILSQIPADEQFTATDIASFFYFEQTSAQTFIKMMESEGTPIESVEYITTNLMRGKRYRPRDVMNAGVKRGLTPKLGKRPSLINEYRALELAIVPLRMKVADLQQQVDRLLDVQENSTLMRSACNHARVGPLPSPSEIIDSAQHYGDTCGVYFLVHQDEIVYVGQSLNIWSRIGTHVSSKKFDRAAYIQVPREKLDLVESLYIHMLKPKLNGRIGAGVVAPLAKDELIKRLGLT